MEGTRRSKRTMEEVEDEEEDEEAEKLKKYVVKWGRKQEGRLSQEELRIKSKSDLPSPPSISSVPRSPTHTHCKSS